MTNLEELLITLKVIAPTSKTRVERTFNELKQLKLDLYQVTSDKNLNIFGVPDKRPLYFFA